jgi:hypothetical protein
MKPSRLFDLQVSRERDCTGRVLVISDDCEFWVDSAALLRDVDPDTDLATWCAEHGAEEI